MFVGKLKALVLLVALYGFDIPAIQAQVLYGSIIGTVTDPSGAVVPKAEVNAVNPQTGETRNATADDAGRYTIGNVLPGTYEVQRIALRDSARPRRRT